MSTLAAPRHHLFLPWAVQEREDPVLEFDRGEGVYFYDRQGRRYLDFLAQLFNCNLGHGNRRVIEAIQRQAERACCVSPQVLQFRAVVWKPKDGQIQELPPLPLPGVSRGGCGRRSGSPRRAHGTRSAARPTSPRVRASCCAVPVGAPTCATRAPAS